MRELTLKQQMEAHMSRKKSAGFDRMSKLAGRDDVFEDTFDIEDKKEDKKEEKEK